ncbi:MAG: DUF432 domain-containing protein [Oceanipulchritudo sp.]|jgi:hypothetical protein
MRSLQQFWSVRRIGEDRVTLARLGPLRLWLARADKEWGFAVEHGEPSTIMDLAQVPEDVVPHELAWTNMLFEQAPREFSLRPAVPDRPLMVKPEHPVAIPPRESGTFFALIPVFIEIVLQRGKEDLVMGTVSSRVLSDTWFGSPTVGDLCYSLPTLASINLAALDPKPHDIVCPLEIHNRSEEMLHLEKLCLRPGYVGLYCGASHLWSSVVHIHHEGLFKSATIRYSGRQPSFEEGLIEITKPQKREEKGLHRLTFGGGFSRDLVLTR